METFLPRLGFTEGPLLPIDSAALCLRPENPNPKAYALSPKSLNTYSRLVVPF